MESVTRLTWSEVPLRIVKAHLERVSDAEASSMPRFDQPDVNTVSAFLERARTTLLAEPLSLLQSAPVPVQQLAAPGTPGMPVELIVSVGRQAEIIDMSLVLVLDLFEQACGASFLTPKERRAVLYHIQQVSKRRASNVAPVGAGLPRVSSGGSTILPAPQGPAKRKRGEEVDHVLGIRARFASVLPVDYLLRFFVAIPSVLEHYDKLGGGTIPEYCKAPMWACVNALLQLLVKEAFTTPSNYVAIL